MSNLRKKKSLIFPLNDFLSPYFFHFFHLIPIYTSYSLSSSDCENKYFLWLYWVSDYYSVIDIVYLLFRLWVGPFLIKCYCPSLVRELNFELWTEARLSGVIRGRRNLDKDRGSLVDLCGSSFGTFIGVLSIYYSKIYNICLTRYSLAAILCFLWC